MPTDLTRQDHATYREAIVSTKTKTTKPRKRCRKDETFDRCEACGDEKAIRYAGRSWCAVCDELPWDDKAPIADNLFLQAEASGVMRNSVN